MLNRFLKILLNIKQKIFPFYKDNKIKFIFKKLQEGFPKENPTARFVGGCVRKYLTGEKIDDIDVATTLTTDEIKDRFKNTNFKVVETGIKHGTITIISDNLKIELTTLRKDIKTDGRHADVEYTDDWRLDSERRDFTINAIYLDINGKIFDPQMGTVDLKNKNVKFIGDPQKRIEEDFLRIIRFIRFKIIYDSNIERSTINAIKQNLNGIRKISRERILDELLKIFDLKGLLEINNNFQLKEIFSMIFPELLYLKRLEKLKKVQHHSKLSKEIIMAILLIDEKDNHEYFSHKYKISNKIKDVLEKFAQDLNDLKKDKHYLDKDLQKNIYKNGKNHLESLNLLNFTINSKIKYKEYLNTLNKITKFKMPNFHINGEFLKQNGMKENATLGKVLNIIEEEWINNNFKISDDRVKELIRINSN